MHNKQLTKFVNAQTIAVSGTRCLIKVKEATNWLLDNDWLEVTGLKGRARILKPTPKLTDAFNYTRYYIDDGYFN